MLKSIGNFVKGIAFFFKLIVKFFKFVLMLTGILSFPRCGGSGYTKEGNKVFYNGKEIGKDFKVLNDVFAKDDSAAYFKTYSIDGADIATFTPLSKHYAKDKNTVYYCDEYREGKNYYTTKNRTIISIKQADPATFTMIGDEYSGYAKDNQRGYFEGMGFNVRDIATLEIIKGSFLKDKYQVYFGQEPIKGSDAQSFRLLNDYYAQDKNHVYIYDYPEENAENVEKNDHTTNRFVVMPCDNASFSLLEYPYSKDATAVFYGTTKIKNVDAHHFSVLANSFSKDNQSVFFKDKKIENVDALTFAVLPQDSSSLDESYYAHDKTHVFLKDKKINGADVLTFKALGLDYAVDSKQVYYKTTVIKGANPNSFKIYAHGYGDEDAEDAKNKYSKGVNIY